jgi:hypothetical protein
MDATKREIRTIDCKLSVRETEGSQEGESRTITGTAIVFNAESEVLDDWGEKFREVILPEAATMEFLNSQDIKMNMLHDRKLTIARANKGVGTLRLSVDERGVNFEFEAPKCDIGDRCLEMVRRGDYSGCSFEFYPKDYEVEREGDNVKITHHSFEFISAITIGMDPAYRQTSVNAREMGKDNTHEAEEAAKREAEAAEQAAKAKAEAEAKAVREYNHRKRQLQMKSL